MNEAQWDDLGAAQEIAAAIGAQWLQGPSDRRVQGASTDTRTLQPGDLFFALRGERFDGHAFVPDALRQGAAGVVVQRPGNWGPAADQVVLQVDDPLLALGRLAAWHRQRFPVPVVAVTGSCGKTTTKEILAAVLGVERTVLASASNFNNEIGLPLTLLRLRAHHQVVVTEMAMRGRGQIAYLAALAAPQIGVVTNIGVSHFELLGSMREIAAAKGELIASLPPEGLAVLNGDDLRVRSLAEQSAAPVWFYGLGSGNAFTIDHLTSRGLAGSDFTLVTPQGSIPVSLPLPGRHNIANALAAAAVGQFLGLSLSQIRAGFTRCRTGDLRLQTVTTARGVRFINDAYNAAPASVRAALDVLAETPATGRRVAVLGDMRELGAVAVVEHLRLGQDLATRPVDRLITVGQLGAEIARGAAIAGFPEEALRVCETPAEAVAFLRAELAPGDLVLVKASRALALETIIQDLLSDPEEEN